MTIDEFIQLTKKEPLKWINYCEIILTPSGGVLIANPSHTEALIQYVMDKEHKSKDEVKNEIPKSCLPIEWIVDKYRLVAVWHCGYMYHHTGPNRFQKRSIEKLEEFKLICSKETQYNKPATEYKNYLYRKSLGIEN